MLKDFYRTLVENSGITNKGYFFIAMGIHIFLIGSMWLLSS